VILSRGIKALEKSVSSAEEIPPEERSNVLTPDEVAAFLKVSPSWLAKSRMRGDGPSFVKIGRLVRYFKHAVLEWVLAQNKRKPPPANAGKAD
jgi:predicted DNA-binding transcriptional regulator AlpA